MFKFNIYSNFIYQQLFETTRKKTRTKLPSELFFLSIAAIGTEKAKKAKKSEESEQLVSMKLIGRSR